MSKVFAPEITTATLLDGMINTINNVWQTVSVTEREFMTYMRHLTNDDSLARPTAAENPALYNLGQFIHNEFEDIATHLGEAYPNQTLIREAFKKSNVGATMPYFTLN